MRNALTCSPKVFDMPQCTRDFKLIALMMPFDPSFTCVASVIKDLAAKSGLKCERADDIWKNSEIIQDVFDLLFRAQIVICDFSGRNPNVFYEAGIAHTLGRDVIPIVRNEEDIPFDLRHHRFIKYLPNGEGLKELGLKLEFRIKQLLSPLSYGEEGGFIPPVVAKTKKFEDIQIW